MMHKFSTGFPQVIHSVILAWLSLLVVLFSITCAEAGQPWVWDRQLFDVNCVNENIAGYRVMLAYLDPHPYPCTIWECDENGENCLVVSGTCIGYTLSSWVLVDTVPDPGAGELVGTWWDAATPPLGAVAMIQIRAVDTAGNLDSGPCLGP